MSRQTILSRWAPLGAALVAGAGLRLWRLGELALIGDESYYWLWSRHLDWAYYDHPAGVAVQTWLSTTLAGESEVGVRWLNAALGMSCIPLAYLLGERMFSHKAGLLAALVVGIGAPYLVTSRFVYTDALQLALLLLNLYCFWRMSEERPGPGLGPAIAWGLTLALLFNTKYSAYLYALALGLAILIDHRRLVTEGRFWLAVALSALGLLPVIVWNATHNWASFRWQLSHAGLSLVGGYNLLNNAYHAVTYLTWPLVPLAIMGLGLVHRPAERLLTLVALFLLLPVALIPANSPRNLVSGLVLLILLAGARWSAAASPRRRVWLSGVLAVLVAVAALYGLGTVLSLTRPSPWPHSSIVPDIRRDAAGWQELGPAFTGVQDLIFAVDYSIASQIWYYSGRPAYTSWGQYRIWGIPDLRDMTIASLDYLPEDLVSERLHQAFREVEGPRHYRFEEPGAVKEVRTWQAEGLLVDDETFLQWFDFLTLLEETP